MKKLPLLLVVSFICLISSAFLFARAQRGPAPGGVSPMISFFVTTKGSGDGGNLNGIAGADYLCQTLAETAGSTKTWHAYLSTRAGDSATTILNARERICMGPWHKSRGQVIAKSVDALHGENNNLNKQTALTEKG